MAPALYKEACQRGDGDGRPVLSGEVDLEDRLWQGGEEAGASRVDDSDDCHVVRQALTVLGQAGQHFVRIEDLVHQQNNCPPSPLVTHSSAEIPQLHFFL